MIKKMDHIVVTTADAESCLNFYEKLGFEAKDTGSRYELYAGNFKINVHILGRELSPHAQNIRTGSDDLCFEISGDIDSCKKQLESKGLTIELGVVTRNGVKGAMKSIYLRDPDGNLIELCSYK